MCSVCRCVAFVVRSCCRCEGMMIGLSVLGAFVDCGTDVLSMIVCVYRLCELGKRSDV